MNYIPGRKFDQPSREGAKYGSLIPGAGLVVAGFRAAGSFLAKLAIQVLVTVSVFGTLVVIQGSPDNLPSPNEFLPNVDNVLGQIDSITSDWGGVQ